MRVGRTTTGKARIFVPTARIQGQALGAQIREMLVTAAGGYTAYPAKGGWTAGNRTRSGGGPVTVEEDVTVFEVLYQQGSAAQSMVQGVIWDTVETLLLYGETEVLVEVNGEASFFYA